MSPRDDRSRGNRGNRNVDPTAIGESLRKLTDELGMTAPEVLLELRRHWNEVVGASVATHAMPSSFRDGALVVTVDAPQWATEIRYLATGIMDALQTRGLAVRELHVRVGRPER